MIDRHDLAVVIIRRRAVLREVRRAHDPYRPRGLAASSNHESDEAE
jgi:hypothetical protein